MRNLNQKKPDYISCAAIIQKRDGPEAVPLFSLVTSLGAGRDVGGCQLADEQLTLALDGRTVDFMQNVALNIFFGGFLWLA